MIDAGSKPGAAGKCGRRPCPFDSLVKETGRRRKPSGGLREGIESTGLLVRRECGPWTEPSATPLTMRRSDAGIRTIRAPLPAAGADGQPCWMTWCGAGRKDRTGRHSPAVKRAAGWLELPRPRSPTGRMRAWRTVNGRTEGYPQNLRRRVPGGREDEVCELRPALGRSAATCDARVAPSPAGAGLSGR